MTLWTVHVQRHQIEVGAQLNFFPNGLEEAEAIPMLALGDPLELELSDGTPFRGILVSADADQATCCRLLPGGDRALYGHPVIAAV